jgi:DNA-binding transcriptional ArsR family regulator
MNDNSSRLIEALERIFHEPNRLAIMSALCAADRGLSFGELKEECDLTDGNLSRHLKVLQEAKAITVKKTFVGEKPRTTVYLSKQGLERFGEYLAALREVLEQAVRVMPAAAPKPGPLPMGKRVRI